MAKTDKEEIRQRTMEAASALLAAIPNKSLLTTNLNKALFYLDLLWFRDHGELVTKNTYIALERGPVLASYKANLIQDLQKADIAKQASVGDALPITLIREMDYKFLSAEVRKIAAKIAPEFARLTAKSVSDTSHYNIGWDIAYSNGQKLGKSPRPINFYIALQQIVTVDPWMKDDTKNLSMEMELACDQGEGVPW